MSNTIVRRRLPRPTPRPVASRQSGTSGPRQLWRPLTALAILACGSATSASLGTVAIRSLSSGAWWRLDDAVAGVLAVGGSLIAAWYALTAAAILLRAVARIDIKARTWGAPFIRTLTVGAGSLTMALSTPLSALADSSTSVPYAESGTVMDDLSWNHNDLDLAWGGVSTRAQVSTRPSIAEILAVHSNTRDGMPEEIPDAEKPPPLARSDTHESTHIVRAGESLWEIAAAELPEAADDIIARRVSQYVDANPAVQRNPDLIFPDQIIAIPDLQP